jgi:hypothetical protein
VYFGNDLISGMRYWPAMVWIGQDSSCVVCFQINSVSGYDIRYVNGLIKTPPGAWNHLAYVYENLDLRIYVNGALSTASGSVRGSSLISSSSVNTTRLFNYLGMAKLDQFYVGDFMLDEVKLYNKALSQAQVQLDMAAASGVASGIC